MKQKWMFFLEFPCFLYDPMNVSNLTSSFSAFSKPILYTRKFSVHELLKPNFKAFEHNLTSLRNELNCQVDRTLFGIAFFGTYLKTDLFQFCGHCWVFQICWHIDCSTLRASSFKIWNSSTGISSPPLALFIVMLSKAHLTSHPRMSGSRWVTTLLLLPQS